MLQPNDSSQIGGNEDTASRSLQPMGFTDILDSMFSLYRKYFRLFVSVFVVYFVLGLAFDLLDGLSALLIFDTERLSALAGLGSLISFGTSLFTSFARIVVSGSLFFCAAQVYLGNRITARAAFEQIRRQFWMFFLSLFLYRTILAVLIIPVALANVIFFIGIGGTVIAAAIFASVISILAALYFGVRWIFCILVAVFEEKSAIRALKRSGELVKGGWWRVFGML